MTATDELRHMLDERGVEWTEGIARPELTQVRIDGKVAKFHQWQPNTLKVSLFDITPEQAIAATLGAGTCKIHDCEGSFSSVNRPVWRCDCGAFMTQYTDATTYHKPRFCPNCGRKVVDE